MLSYFSIFYLNSKMQQYISSPINNFLNHRTVGEILNNPYLLNSRQLIPGILEMQAMLFQIGSVFIFIFTFIFYLFIFYFYLFIQLVLAALGLHCYTRAFSSCSEPELLIVAVCRLLIAVASLVAEHRLLAHGLQQL